MTTAGTLGLDRDQPLLQGKQDQVGGAVKVEQFSDLVFVEFHRFFT